MRLLLIEDEPDLLDSLAQALRVDLAELFARLRAVIRRTGTRAR